MAKNETVLARVSSEIKQKADEVFHRLGLTTSQAITLFLTASVNKNGLPFELALPNGEEEDLMKEDVAFAKSIATIEGISPSEEAMRIVKLYSRGDIDYETAEFAIARLYKR